MNPVDTAETDRLALPWRLICSESLMTTVRIITAALAGIGAVLLPVLAAAYLDHPAEWASLPLWLRVLVHGPLAGVAVGLCVYVGVGRIRNVLNRRAEAGGHEPEREA